MAHKLRDRRDYFRLCSPRNDPKFDLGLFEIFLFNRNQRCFLVSPFFSEQIEEPNGSNSLDWYLDLMRVEIKVGSKI